jgi:hypothetical protein
MESFNTIYPPTLENDYKYDLLFYIDHQRRIISINLYANDFVIYLT